MHVYIEIGYINKMLTFDRNLQRQNSTFVKTLTMIPCYNPMQLSEENVAICVSFAPMKTLSNSDGYFSSYTIFYHDKYRNKIFRDSVNKTDENQDFRKGNTCM